MTLMNVVIFSKDRPAQLDVCLRSLKQSCRDSTGLGIKILYVATTDDYEKGYEIVRTTQPSWCSDLTTFHRQGNNFKKELTGLVDPSRPITMFLVDDIIFKTPFATFDPEIKMVQDSDRLVALSLRLDKNITHCYALNNQPTPVPQFVKGNVWRWKDHQGDWGYPYSVDGNIYRTDDILARMKACNYNNPNQFESALNDLPGPRPEYMACYVNGSKLVNIPANRVQDECKNRHANSFSAEELNQRFLAGETISMATVSGVTNTTVHAEIPFIWQQS